MLGLKIAHGCFEYFFAAACLPVKFALEESKYALGGSVQITVVLKLASDSL
jgi:hypothetical protein